MILKDRTKQTASMDRRLQKAGNLSMKKSSAVSLNKKALHLYLIKEKFQAGLSLKGSEVKSLRAGACNLKDSYISFRGGELFLQKAYIAPYPHALNGGHEPERLRKLLLTKQELSRLFGLIQQKKMTCVPLQIYFTKGKAKAEIALVQRKSQADKRDALREKTAERAVRQALKRRRRG